MLGLTVEVVGCWVVGSAGEVVSLVVDSAVKVVVPLEEIWMATSVVVLAVGRSEAVVEDLVVELLVGE